MINKLRVLVFLLLLPLIAYADNVVIEVLISSKDNQVWTPKKSMHLTIAHLKNVEGADILAFIDIFNQNKEKLLKEALAPGFRVKKFNVNGFGKGYHILEADNDTYNRLEKLNSALYQYLHDSYGISFTDITSPKYIYAKGYTPHIELIELTNDKFPPTKTFLQFVAPKLSVRILSFERYKETKH